MLGKTQVELFEKRRSYHGNYLTPLGKLEDGEKGAGGVSPKIGLAEVPIRHGFQRAHLILTNGVAYGC